MFNLKSFADIKPVTFTALLPDLSDSVTELASSMVKSFTPQMCISVEEENILVYIGGYIYRKVSKSLCDECKQTLIGNFDINNKLHTFLSKKQYSNVQGGGLIVPSKKLLDVIGSIEILFRNIIEQILHLSHIRTQIITFSEEKLTESHAVCGCFTFIVHIYVTFRLHHVLRENNQHIITSRRRRNRKVLQFNHE